MHMLCSLLGKATIGGDRGGGGGGVKALSSNDDHT